MRLKDKLKEMAQPNPERERLNTTLDRTNERMGDALQRLRERLAEKERKGLKLVSQ